MARERYEPCPKCQQNGKDTRGNNLVIFPDGGKHCFACGYHIHGKPFSPIKNESDRDKVTPLLPYDFTREIPTNAFKWLLQYGLPYSYWKEQGIGYSPASGRLIFEVGGPLAFSIGRLVEDRRDDKGRPWPKWRTYGDPHKHCELILPDGRREEECNSVVLVEPKQVVLVEDLISAHKIANAGYCSIPLFGTRISNPVIYYLLHSNSNVVLWLDKDQELNVKKQALNLESIIGKQVKVVITDKDPKWLSKEEINENLRNVS